MLKRQAKIQIRRHDILVNLCLLNKRVDYVDKKR